MTGWCERIPGCTYLKSAEYDLGYCEEQAVWAGSDQCGPHLWKTSRALQTIYTLQSRQANRAGHRLAAMRFRNQASAEKERREICVG
jgi:hypothetical protein